MRVLGVDLSSVNTGLAILDDSKANPLVAYLSLEPPKELDQTRKIFYISAGVMVFEVLYGADQLAIEDTFFKTNVTTLKLLNRIAGAVQANWYFHKRTSPYFYQAKSVRLTFPNLKGSSTKEEIVEAVNKFFGLRGKIKNDNIADAIVLAYHHLQKVKDNTAEVIREETESEEVIKEPETQEKVEDIIQKVKVLDVTKINLENTERVKNVRTRKRK